MVLEVSYATGSRGNHYNHFGKMSNSLNGTYKYSRVLECSRVVEYLCSTSVFYSYSTTKYMPERNADICSPKVMYKNVHSSNVHNSPK